MVIPIGRGNDTMFEPDPFILSSYIEQCKSIYGVPPRPHWVTSYYGGHVRILYLSSQTINFQSTWSTLLSKYFVGCHVVFTTNTKTNISENFMAHCQDIKLILHRFGSNIIFSNGLRDPYSTGG